jgi:hypothetical protein
MVTCVRVRVHVPVDGCLHTMPYMWVCRWGGGGGGGGSARISDTCIGRPGIGIHYAMTRRVFDGDIYPRPVFDSSSYYAPLLMPMASITPWTRLPRHGRLGHNG